MRYDDERYTIRVSEEKVEIEGTLTIREAFDFLNFFDREGFNTIEDGDHTCLCFRKRDIDEERRQFIIKNNLESEKTYQLLYDQETEKNKKLSKKIDELDFLIRNLMAEESDKVMRMKKKIADLEKFNTLLKLKTDPEAAKICAVEGPEGEDLTDFAEQPTQGNTDGNATSATPET